LNDFVHKETLLVYDESTHMTTRHNSQASTASDTNPYGQGGKIDSQMTPEQAFKAEHQIKIEHGPGT
jgi:hypothetical protein